MGKSLSPLSKAPGRRDRDNVWEECHEMLSSEHDIDITLVNSQHMLFTAPDMHKIGLAP